MATHRSSTFCHVSLALGVYASCCLLIAILAFHPSAGRPGKSNEPITERGSLWAGRVEKCAGANGSQYDCVNNVADISAERIEILYHRISKAIDEITGGPLSVEQVHGIRDGTTTLIQDNTDATRKHLGEDPVPTRRISIVGPLRSPGRISTTEPARASHSKYARVAENGSWYGQLNANGVAKTVYVRGYYRRDGTYVRGHYRSSPGSSR